MDNVTTDKSVRETRLEIVERELHELRGHVQSLLHTAKGFFFYRVAIEPGPASKIRVVMVSPSITEVTGMKDVDNFDSWFTNIHPDDKPKIIEASNHSVATGNPYDQVARWYHPVRCEWIWVRTVSQPVFDSTGVLTHFNGLCIDISQQKQSEEVLRESESRFRSLIEDAPVAIHVQSEGRYLYLNPAMLKLLGASRQEDLQDTEIFSRVAPEYRDAVRERMTQQRETEKTTPLMELDLLKLDGTRVTVEATAIAVVFQNRRAHLAFIHDITARKQIEAETQRQRDVLQKTNQELNESQEQLQKLSEQLLSAQEAERRRIAVELHDGIGQYLCGLKFNLDGLVHQMEMTGEAPIKSESLYAASELAAHTVNDIRRLVTTLRPAILDSNSLDKAVAWLCAQFNGNITVSLEMDLEPVDKDLSETVRLAIFRVIQEALANAIRHSGANRIRIELKLTEQGRVKVSVQDNGKGFNPALVLGLGLGMPSMRDRAKASRGNLKVTSTLGQGTTVEADWPQRFRQT